MKTSLQKTLGNRVHGLWFILACLLLVCTLTYAILVANEVVWRMDRNMEQITPPAPTLSAPPSPLASPNPETSA